jgi:hypothetical protein
MAAAQLLAIPSPVGDGGRTGTHKCRFGRSWILSSVGIGPRILFSLDRSSFGVISARREPDDTDVSTESSRQLPQSVRVPCDRPSRHQIVIKLQRSWPCSPHGWQRSCSIPRQADLIPRPHALEMVTCPLFLTWDIYWEMLHLLH